MAIVEPITSAALTDTDRVIFDELIALEDAMARNYEWVYQVIAPWLGDSLLEVGSGVGVMSKYLVDRGGPVVLTDYHPAYLAHLRARFGDDPRVSFELLDLRRPSFEPVRRLDTIVCLNVLEHIEDDRRALRALAGLLPAGGRLVLQVPNHPILYGSLDEAFGHFRRYSRPALATALTASGFRPTTIRNFNPLAIPGWLLAAKLQRARSINVRAARLFNRMVPLARRLDFLSRLGGLALIACAERQDAPAP